LPWCQDVADAYVPGGILLPLPCAAANNAGCIAVGIRCRSRRADLRARGARAATGAYGPAPRDVLCFSISLLVSSR
jgi:hypothetical protein